jgi:hypothetical protein
MKKVLHALALAMSASVAMAAFGPVESVTINNVPGTPPKYLLQSITAGGGQTYPLSGLAYGSTIGSPSGGSIANMVDFDLNTVSTGNGSWTKTVLFGGINFTDSNGSLPDFFLFEAAGSGNPDDVSVAAIFTDDTIGMAVACPVDVATGWGNPGLPNVNSPINNGQPILGLAWDITDLKDALGNPLPAGSTIKGIQILPGSNIDPCGFYAVVPPSAIDHFSVVASSPQVAGVAFDVTITAEDASYVTVNDSTTVVTASGSSGSLMEFDWNSDGTYGDNSGTLVAGVKTIKARTKKAQTVTLSASAGLGGSITTLSPPDVLVTADAFNKLQILAPGEATAPGTATGKTGTPFKQAFGYSFNVTVNAVDAYWNVVNSVYDTVGITATDATATLPPDAGLWGGGTGSFAVTLGTNGTFTLTATDVTDHTKTPGTVVVAAADASLWNLDLSLKTFTNNTGVAETRVALTNAGLSVANEAGGSRAVVFDANGAHFGANGDGGTWWAARNYLRTLENYGNVSFTAYITIDRSHCASTAYFGIGTGSQAGEFGEADRLVANASGLQFYLPNSTSQGAINVKVNGAQPSSTGGIPNGENSGKNIKRVKMVYDSVAQTMQFAVDNDFSGLSFSPDWTSPVYDLVGLGVAAEWASGDASKIYFGGDGEGTSPATNGTIYTAFKVTAGLETEVPVTFGATAPGASAVWMMPVVSGSAIDGSVATVLDASVKLYQDGVQVASGGSRVGADVFIAYTNSTALLPGSTHTNMLTCADSNGKNHTNYWLWTVFNYRTIPSSYALGTPATIPGLLVKTFATDSAGPGPSATPGIIAAEQQIAGGLVDASGNPYPNLADPSSGSDSNVNWSLIAGAAAGNFNANTEPFGQYTDREFVGVNPTSGVAVNFTTEVNAYLRLVAGNYRMLVNSDDGFEISVAPGLGNPDGTVLGGFLAGGHPAADVSVDFVIAADGDYPFRLLYYQAGGGASAEWIMQNMTTGEKVLINDEFNPGTVLAFQTGSPRATLTRMLPASGYGPLPINQGVEFKITNGRTALTGTPTLLVNGQPVTPSIVSGGGVTTITWSPNGNHPYGSSQTAQLIWTENTTPSPTVWTNSTSFTVKQAALADMPYGTPWIEAADYDFGGGQMVPAANDYYSYTGNAYQTTNAWGDPFFPILNVDYFNFFNQGDTGPYRGNASLHPTTPTPNIAAVNSGSSAARPNGVFVTQSREIGWVYSGYGVNYTRTLPNGIYNPVISVAAPNAHGSGVSLVKSGAGTTNQTLQPVGTFRSATGSGGFGTYALRQLTAVDGTPAALYVNGPGGSGTVTLRWTLGLPGYSGFVLNANWMALRPMTNVPPVIAAVSPANGATGVTNNGQLVFTVQTYDRPVNPGSIALQFNGSAVTPTVSGPDNSGVMTVSYSYNVAYTSTNTYSLSLSDTGIPAPVVTKTTSGSFVVMSKPIPPSTPISYQASGGQLVLSWDQGLLLQATNVMGPWIPNPSATSPFTNNTDMPVMFYKVLIAP